MSEPLTPYAEAVALSQSGLSNVVIAQRLKTRGLDDEAVGLLLAAVRARSAEQSKSAPRAEWVDPAPVEAVAAPTEVPVAPAGRVDLGPCTRCGSFVTADAHQVVLKKLYCLACAARPDVNFPKAYRDAHWGKRDGWAWFFGVLSVFSILASALSVAGGQFVIALPLLASAVVYALFWSGFAPARLLLIGVAIVTVATSVATGGAPGVMSLVLVVWAIRSPRNKLFFQIEPTEDELVAGWKASHDNQAALWGGGLALVAMLSVVTWFASLGFAFVTFGLGLLGALLGGVGLSRVNPTAVPPVGQRRAALVGLIGGAVSTLAAVALVVVLRLQR